MDELDGLLIQHWLQKNKTPHKVLYPDVAQNIVDWIVSGQQEPLADISQRLWQRVWQRA